GAVERIVPGGFAVVVEAQHHRAAGKFAGALEVFGFFKTIQIAGDAVEFSIGAEEDFAAVVIGAGAGGHGLDAAIEGELGAIPMKTVDAVGDRLAAIEAARFGVIEIHKSIAGKIMMEGDAQQALVVFVG